MADPLVKLARLGQSLWLDYIRRGLITSGELQAMVDQDGLRGVTSNPAIFEKALAGSDDYDQQLKALVAQGAAGPKEIFERLAIQDIQLAADVMHAVYLRTGRRDGFVSLEVSPYLAHDVEKTIEEAKRLWAAVGRENVMIKVPATSEGIPAIEQLIAEGLNINVTLIFAEDVYEQVAEAYMAGLERLLRAGRDLAKVASVASVFISRIDAMVDEELSQELDATRDRERRARLKGLLGKVAIANARLIYARYRELSSGPRWKAIAEQGAGPQRLLWASTSTKNPKYSKTLYVDELIGPDTVNTMPAETLTLYRAHGRPRLSLTANWTESLDQAHEILDTLGELGISLKEVTDRLLVDGVKLFSDAFDKLLAAVEKKRQALLGAELASQHYEVGDAADAMASNLDEWRAAGKVRRLWNGDASLWSDADEDEWLGWLHVVENQIECPEPFRRIREEVHGADFRHLLLLGMGGSSLCPHVLARTFGRQEGFPELLVLDSTVPAHVKTCEDRIDPAQTLFIVSSKSGGTTEPNVFKRYFFEKVREALGDSEAGSRFLAITDPGTKLHALAKADRFRAIFHGVSSIGGRYSALSNFGMIPAAAMGLDVPDFLDRAEVMVQACGSCVPPEANPGVVLGTILGTLAGKGRDKITLISSPAINTLGTWLEQLLAESTGKLGRGLIPVEGEPLGPPDVYGQDRLFVYVRLNSGPSAEQDAAVDALEKSGQPVVRIALEHPMDLGQEFFRWEIAAAVAGSMLAINPFDQPDVEASKVATRRLTAEFEKTGGLPDGPLFFEEDGLRLFADPRNADALTSKAGSRSLQALLGAHLARLRPGDYFAVNAYVEMNDENGRELHALRSAVRDAKRVATTLGYGPRFLHSTGQLHKGGPNSGVFLQITSDDAGDLPIPGQNLRFGVLKQAQALGDFQVLAECKRRALRVHLGADVSGGLARLRELIQSALG